MLAAADDPLSSLCWRACLDVSLNPEAVAAMPVEEFMASVRAALPGWGGKRPWRPIVAAVRAAAHDPGGIGWERGAALERAALVLEDWRLGLAELAELERRMVAILDGLGLSGLVTTIPALSAVGAAAILAETGDPARFDCARAWVKHAGACPRDNESGNSKGQSRVSRRGRPLLRTAAWRASWPLIIHNEVFAARYAHLTTREGNRLNDGQARIAVVASLLRQLYVVVTRRVAWDPALAAGKEVEPAA